MDNFQAVMLGRPVDEDLTDDGWTQHYAKVQNPPRVKGMDIGSSSAMPRRSTSRSWRRTAIESQKLVADPDTAEILKPYYRYLCKRPCFHDEFLSAVQRTQRDPGRLPGWARPDHRGGSGRRREASTKWTPSSTAPGFEAELTPLARRAGHDIVGRGGVTLADAWADGASSLFGMMSRGFPNLFVMPAPAQQAVVTVNYTQLAVLGAAFVGRTVGAARSEGREVVQRERRRRSRTGPSRSSPRSSTPAGVMAACTPSRINQEGHPETLNPRNGNFGRGLGDYFAYRDLLEQWLEQGECEGLELDDQIVTP